jgi:hypothetical protein
VYDELAAKKPVTWTFRLNAPDTIAKVDETSAAVRAANATATAKTYPRTGTRTQVTDQFWGGPMVDFQRKLATTKNQWHANIDTQTKTAKERFLTVIQIRPGETDPAKPLKIAESQAGGLLTLVVGPWKVSAEMDASKPSLLTATDDQTAAIVTGSAAESIQFGGQTYRAEPQGATVLVENSGVERTVQQAVDRLPDAVLFSNRP